eukprot:scaffold25461_cov50-Phaeocystis_antarctica.AAC.1
MHAREDAASSASSAADWPDERCTVSTHAAMAPTSSLTVCRVLTFDARLLTTWAASSEAGKSPAPSSLSSGRKAPARTTSLTPPAPGWLVNARSAAAAARCACPPLP